MILGVTSCGPGLNDKVEARFGRCPYFTLVDTETLKFESIPNPNMTLGSGTGIQSAQLMADKGVTVMLTGNCGPNAFHVFSAAGIHVITGVDGIVQDAVQRFKSHKLVTSSGPNVQDHFGMRDGGRMDGKGSLGGSRSEGGRGIGMRRGMGMRTAVPDQTWVISQASQIDVPVIPELDLLKETATDIRRQLAEIESKIEAISGKE